MWGTYIPLDRPIRGLMLFTEVMMRLLRRFLLAFFILILLALTGTGSAVWAAPAAYIFTSLDGPGAIHTNAFDINDHGQIVGFFNTQGTNCLGGTCVGFLSDGVTFVPLAVPGALETRALGINNAGDIVGATNSLHGFLKHGDA